MTENAKKKNYLEIMNRIDEFTKDADWSIEELREDLMNEGINPDKLIERVRQNILPLLSEDEKEIKNEWLNL